ncbi:MAG: histidinol dehydrogenase [Christensenellales bacterium]|jgi:histidinol dehydrogenase
MIKTYDAQEDLESLRVLLASRSQLDAEEVQRSVRSILADVRQKGDEALFSYIEALDGAKLAPESLRLSQLEMQAALERIDPALRAALERAAENIRTFHEKQVQTGFFDDSKPGILLGQIVRPVGSVGLYVPGGTATYPSSVLMNVIPAKVAGVSRIAMATPPKKSGISDVIVAAAKIGGVDEIYQMGGAQAIAAFAFGTASVPRVDKITGPGNIYVTMAKREVYGYVGIDMLAGPSEILVIADDSANPAFVAADMLSQAEHDVQAASVLVTDSKTLAQTVEKELESQLSRLPRKEIACRSLEQYGMIILVENLQEAMELSNLIAPEHLELAVEDPQSLLPLVEHAGSIFLGHYSPEPLGDYYAGPNHVLPTSSTARFFSPLGVYDFIKRSSVIGYDKESLQKAADDIMLLAKHEGLHAHSRSIGIRKE